MIIVLDTNVVVSGILRPFGKPAMILRLVAAGRIRCAYDLRLLTGNKRHFPRGESGRVKIDSPGEFLEQWGPKIGPA